jgi:broad specificity phosphatase PhoE
MRIKIMLIRHSLSCSNLTRLNAEHFRDKQCHYHAAVYEHSQQIRDPSLTALGRKMAETYGSRLRKRIETIGFDLSKATIGSSSLRRAKETAALLFPAEADELVVFPHLSEHGRIPENTPTEHRTTRPGWREFLKHVYKRFAPSKEMTEIIAVSHGGYMSDVWREISSCIHSSFHNLDALVFEGELDSRGNLTVVYREYIKYDGINPTDGRTKKDYCPMPRSNTRKHRSSRRKTHRKSRR